MYKVDGINFPTDMEKLIKEKKYNHVNVHRDERALLSDFNSKISYMSSPHVMT
jgi:hypothetical protein